MEEREMANQETESSSAGTQGAVQPIRIGRVRKRPRGLATYEYCGRFLRRITIDGVRYHADNQTEVVGVAGGWQAADVYAGYASEEEQEGYMLNAVTEYQKLFGAYSNVVQLHLVPAKLPPQRQPKQAYAVVLLYKVQYDDGPFVHMFCSECVECSWDPAVYFCSAEGREKEELPEKEVCEHMLQAVAQTLYEAKVQTKRLTAWQLQATLSRLMVEGNLVNPVGMHTFDTECLDIPVRLVFATKAMSYYVFSYHSGRFYCNHGKCRGSGRTTCRHVQLFSKELNKFKRGNECEEVRQRQASKPTIQVHTQATWDYIKFEHSYHVRERESRYDEYMRRMFPRAECGAHCVLPEVDVCQYCGGELERVQITKRGTTGRIFSNTVLRAIFFMKQCVNRGRECFGRKYFYNGADAGFINVENRVLVAGEKAIMYMRMYAHSGLSAAAWWGSHHRPQQEGEPQDDHGQLRTLVGRGLTAVGRFCQFPEDTFVCCGAPKAISLDGTVLGTKYSEVQGLQRPWLSGNKVSGRATYRAERQFPDLDARSREVLQNLLDSKATRGQVRQLGRVECGKGQEQGKKKGKGQEQEKSEGEGKNKALELVRALVLQRSREAVCPMKLRAFVEFLLKTVAPVSSLVPHDQVWRVAHYRKKENHGNLLMCDTLRRYAPVMADVVLLVIECTRQGPEVLKVYGEFVRQIQEIDRKVSLLADHEEVYTMIEKGGGEEEMQASVGSHEKTELWTSGCYFPGLPLIRRVAEITLRAERQCTKHASLGIRGAPGVMLFYCLDHSKCIGFVVLQDPESPKQVFEQLVARFPEAPRIVIYDNGCNLHEYAMNRAPYYFRNTKFLVDAFHFKTHRQCAKTFSTEENEYEVRHYNVQLMEQRNMHLAKLKSTSLRMNLGTFLEKILFTVAIHNIESDKRRRQRQRQRAEE